MKPTHFYVLINFKGPVILSEEDGEPIRFYEVGAARKAASKQTACRAVGYSVLAWDPVRGGLGAIGVESWSAAAEKKVKDDRDGE